MHDRKELLERIISHCIATFLLKILLDLATNNFCGEFVAEWFKIFNLCSKGPEGVTATIFRLSVKGSKQTTTPNVL